jgi:hypothetical protein
MTPAMTPTQIVIRVVPGPNGQTGVGVESPFGLGQTLALLGAAIQAVAQKVPEPSPIQLARGPLPKATNGVQ